MRRFLLLLALLFGGVATAMAQMGDITGQVVSRTGRLPISGAEVVLSSDPQKTTTTASDGSFEFTGVPYGTYTISVEALEYLPSQVNVKVDLPVRDVNFITMVAAAPVEDLDAANFADFDMESGDNSMAMPSSLSASQDVFSNIAGYTFGEMRFRMRGYDTSTEEVYLNGIRLNDAISGYSPWSLWSGLNDATRNQESEGALAINRYGVGGVSEITQINARASELRTGFRTSLVGATAQYATRIMATYASGMQDNGWAYAFSVSTRQGPNFAVDGVYYDAWAYYAGIEKQFNANHRLSLTVFGVPTDRGAQMAATQETYNLVGSNFYNPNWGYQNGKVRNARVRSYHEPVAILNYDWQISDKLKFELGTSYRFGQNGYSALDWNNAADPKPDYHRNLPSYYDNRDQRGKSDALIEYWKQNDPDFTQINWERLYNINRNSTNDVDRATDPDGFPLADGRSSYIVSERHTDQNDFNLRGTFTYQIDDASALRFGVAGRRNVTNYYTSVKDLLGGDYWVNVDNFAERDFGSNSIAIYNDVVDDGTGYRGNMDNFIVKEGDKYGYDYYANVTNAQAWATYTIQRGGFEGFLAGEGGYATFYKDSKYRKGSYTENSYGKSEQPDFITYKGKLGLAYSFNPQHKVSFNGIVSQDAPNFDDAFVSPRSRNDLAPHLKVSQTFGGDLSYSMRTSFLTLRASAYYTYIKDLSRLISFYDDLQNSFVNFAISGIDQQHAGIELGFKIPLITELSLSGAVNLGHYTYANNPVFTQTADNSSRIIHEDEPINWKGFRLESTPQTALNLSLDYRTGNNWFFGLTASYYDDLYLSMNPLLRTPMFAEMVAGGELPFGGVNRVYNELSREEKLDPAFVLSADIGHTWYVNYRYQLGFSLNIKNIMNDTSIRTGGFEQMRIREPNQTVTEYTPYDSKYYYLFGLNFYLNFYLRF